MAYAVIHLTKLKGGRLSNMLKHSRRSAPATRIRDNIDPARSDLNQQLYAIPSMGIEGGGGYAAICDHITHQGVQRRVRKNAVVCVEAVLSASPEAFAHGGPCDNVATWAQDNMRWLKERYSDNLLEAHLHMDEATPHIHAYFVPVTDDKRLCSRDYCTGRDKLRALQSEYPQAMQSMGYKLQRGIGGNRRTSEKEYRRQVALGQAQHGIDPPKLRQVEIVGNKLGPVVTTTTTAKVAGAKMVKQLTAQVNSLAGELGVSKGKLEQVKRRISAQQTELEQLRPIAAAVRGLPVGQVVKDWQAATGKTPPLAIDKCRNAIDATKLLEHCDYKSAVQILAVNYGVEDATRTAKEQSLQNIDHGLPKMIMSGSKPRPKWAQMAAKRAEKKQEEQLPGWKKLLKLGLLWPLERVIDYPPPPDNLDQLLAERAAAEAVLAWALRRAVRIAQDAGIDTSKMEGMAPSEIRKIAETVLKKEGCSADKAEQFLPELEQKKQIQAERDGAEQQAFFAAQTGTAEGHAAADQILKAVKESPQIMSAPGEQKGVVLGPKPPSPPTSK